MLHANIPSGANDLALANENLMSAAEGILSQHDGEWGGFGEAPKFPPSMTLDFLLALALHSRRRKPSDVCNGRSTRPHRKHLTQWREAESSTRSVVDSPATAWTVTGSSRISRKCSTTTGYCWISTVKGTFATAIHFTPLSSAKLLAGFNAKCRPPVVHSTHRSMLTPTAKKAGHTFGCPMKLRLSSVRQKAKPSATPI